MGEHGEAGVLEFFAQFASRKAGGTPPHQLADRGRQTAVSGKADVLVVPKPVAVKPGSGPERVPFAIMGVTAEITHQAEESPHRDERIVKRLSQLGQDPARTLAE